MSSLMNQVIVNAGAAEHLWKARRGQALTCADEMLAPTSAQQMPTSLRARLSLGELWAPSASAAWAAGGESGRAAARSTSRI